VTVDPFKRRSFTELPGLNINLDRKQFESRIIVGDANKSPRAIGQAPENKSELLTGKYRDKLSELRVFPGLAEAADGTSNARFLLERDLIRGFRVARPLRLTARRHQVTLAANFQ
jgi:hypothetical protein